MKITVHIDIEITDQGEVKLCKGSYTPRERANVAQVDPQELSMFAAAFVAANTGRTCPAEPHPDESIPLFEDVQILDTTPTPSASSRGRIPIQPGPQRPAPALSMLMSVGVTAIVAKELCARVGSARAEAMAKWMRSTPGISNPDAVARKLASR